MRSLCCRGTSRGPSSWGGWGPHRAESTDWETGLQLWGGLGGVPAHPEALQSLPLERTGISVFWM